MMIVVYSFDYDTGLYTGERVLGVDDLDPRAPGVVLVPGNCTIKAPPRCGKGLITVWRNGQWIVVELPPEDLEASYYAQM